MGVEKQGSRGVGGFFQLFDWNAKSRKKLFSSKSDVIEQTKQKKRSDGNFPMTRLHPMDEDEFIERSSFKGCSDYSCASSVTDEEGYVNRAPGVVARLMGLDSLPTSNSMGPYSTPYSDSQSLRDANLQRKNLEELNHDYQIMHSENIRNKVEAPVRNSVEPKLEKMKNRPIEKFQTEILPPKSAKSIPLTHHKLLSPIKSPGFVPSQNAAHIMEAAAKIIEPGPQAASTKAKMPLVGSSSAPLKVRDLKEKAEASRRPVESSAAKYLKGQSMNRSCNGSGDIRSFAVSTDSEDRSTGSKNNGKSISLALQAKVNVQKREGLNPSGSRGVFGQKEQNEVMTSHLFKSQPNSQKSKHKKSMESSSNVLKPNNQKQNCAMDGEKLPAKPSVSNSQSRKAPSGDSTFGRHKNSSKSGSRKLGIEVVDNKKELPYSRTNNVSRKKRSIDGSFHFEKSQAVDSMLIDKTDKPIESRSVTDRQFSWAEGGSKRKGADVVSFTFTAPMTRSILGGSEISRQIADKTNCFSSDSTYSAKSSSLRHNVIGGDALSILLEQKLRELTHGIESSQRKTGSAGSSSNSQDLVAPDFEALSSTPILHEKRSRDGTYIDKLGSQFRPNFSSTDPHGLVRKYKLQGVDEMDECSSNGAELRKFLDHRYPSPISVLEPSFFTESCNSSNTTDSTFTEGGKQCSSVQAQEVIGMFSSKKFHLMEADADLSDSASSTSTRTVARTHVFVTDYVGSTSWELEYVKEILCNVELMFKDFTMGRAREIINPRLFDQLESKKRAFGSQREEEPKVRRKVIFDCVSECMDLRCRRYKDGGSTTWAKGLWMVRRKEWLAEEVYKEIMGWRGLGDCMVDELVDRDMSSQNGRWLDFEVEAFELGVEIESRILSSLIDDVVDDVLLF